MQIWSMEDRQYGQFFPDNESDIIKKVDLHRNI